MFKKKISFVWPPWRTWIINIQIKIEKEEKKAQHPNGFEPTASSLWSMRSTAVLQPLPHCVLNKAKPQAKKSNWHIFFSIFCFEFCFQSPKSEIMVMQQKCCFRNCRDSKNDAGIFFLLRGWEWDINLDSHLFMCSTYDVSPTTAAAATHVLTKREKDRESEWESNCVCTSE